MTNGTVMDTPVDWAEINDVVLSIWKYCAPVVILLGTVGNGLSVLVYSRKTMRQTTLGTQLLLLAASNLLFLYLSCVDKWARYVYSIYLSESSPVVCKLYMWLLTFSAMTSPWILVVITLGRIRSVFRPLDTWTQQTSRLVGPRMILVVCSVFLALNSHYFYGYGEAYLTINSTRILVSNCDLDVRSPYFRFYVDIWLSVYYSLTFYIPFIILFFGNIAILLKLGGCGENGNILQSSRSTPPTRSQDQARKSLKLVLGLNVLFLAMVTPNTVVVLGEGTLRYTYSKLFFHVFLAVGRMLLYANSFASFFFYLLTKQYRAELLALFSRKQGKGAASGTKIGVIAETVLKTNPK